jgi:hypothetical protein
MSQYPRSSTHTSFADPSGQVLRKPDTALSNQTEIVAQRASSEHLEALRWPFLLETCSEAQPLGRKLKLITLEAVEKYERAPLRCLEWYLVPHVL